MCEWVGGERCVCVLCVCVLSACVCVCVAVCRTGARRVAGGGAQGTETDYQEAAMVWWVSFELTFEEWVGNAER